MREQGGQHRKLLEQCTECGKCCTGAGEVWIDSAEAAAMAQRLELDTPTFLEKYTKDYTRRQGWYFLKTRPGDVDGACIFLEPDSNLCRVHDVRPLMCKTYPWWPALVDEDTWQQEKRETCEGFDHEDAPPQDVDHALRMLQESRAYVARRERAPLAKKVKKRAAAASKGFGGR
ncbi:unnamed protein product [Pedinophyceae sp. YPF-701]|nr:unnamed protein product [Pedinophyceae sp. YPF-701]